MFLLSTAIIGNGDYSIGSGNTGQFNSNNMAQPDCLLFLQILDDGFVEEREKFTVQLNGNEFADVLNTSESLTVTIEDNDGRYKTVSV